MNDKGFLGSRNYQLPNPKHLPNPDFEEFLEVINLFSDNLRKPYKAAVLLSRSIAEFIKPLTTYDKFNKEFFELNRNKMKPHDFNNVILIRALVERNYQLLLRLFNEAPSFMSHKLNLHHNSRCYFLLKSVLLFANLADPYNQMNESILYYLESQLQNPDTSATEIHNDEDKCIEILGIKTNFFSCLCAAEGGEYVKFIRYLATKDNK